MKKWLIFGGGVVTGVILTFLFAFIFFSSRSGGDDGVTMFEKPGDVVEVNGFKVFQVIGKNAALVKGQTYNKSDWDIYTGPVFLLINGDDKYYYDEETIKVPDGMIVRQVGIYQYQTKSEFDKTVPIIQIMDK